MPIATRYGNLTDEELLRKLHDTRFYSPVIEELCQRLERVNGPVIKSDANQRVECPACEAHLLADYEPSFGGDMFTIKLDKENVG